MRLFAWVMAGMGSVLIGLFPLTTASKTTELSAPAVNQIAKQITVRIDGQSTGTGVIVQRSASTYTVLTAEHVVATPDEYEIIAPEGKTYLLDYKTVKKLPGVDLALLQFNSSQTYTIANLGNSDRLTEGIPVFVAGFPGQDSVIKASVYNFTSGQLTARASQPTDKGYALVYTNRTLPGMSGGPVLDAQGQLIGIHGLADGQRLERQSETVFIKTGFNLGIPINTALGLMTNTPLPRAIPKSTSASDYFVQAESFARSGKRTEALTAANQAIRANANFAAAYVVRGNVRLNQNDLQGAIADFNQAIRLDSTLVSAYMGRGLTATESGDRGAALADYSRAIDLSPSYGLAYYNRGVVYYNQGNKTAALEDLRKAAELAQQQGDQQGYQQAMETLKIAGKECRMSIYGICDR